MYGTKQIDTGREIDWGKTSEDYARFRPSPPDSLFEKLQALGVGLKGQNILDLGTGTGVMARKFAKQGALVIGTDLAEGQIEMAKHLTHKQNLEIEFRTQAAEESDFEPNSFDVISANQCFLYFDRDQVFPRIKSMLKPGGVLVTSHFSWMPFLSSIAKASEELILKHNPDWTAHSYEGNVPAVLKIFQDHFRVIGFFVYDEKIPFTRESWRGRIRASRGISATLNPEQVEAFDREHNELLHKITDEDSFDIIHRIDAHIMTPL